MGRKGDPVQTDIEKTLYLIDKALSLIDHHLHKQADLLLTFVPNEAFLVFAQRLREYQSVLRTPPLPPRSRYDNEMSREIINTWPYTFVGAGIVEAERAFLACLAKNDPGSSDEKNR
jgi:hypothetical protein